MSPRFNMWVPSPPRPVIRPAAYYLFSDGGVMEAPLPSLILGFWLFKFFFKGFIFFVNIHLKRKYTVIVIITARVFQWNRGEAIGLRLKVVRVHHAFARHQLVALNFGPRFDSLGCFIPHDFMRIEDWDGSALGLRMLKFVDDIAF